MLWGWRNRFLYLSILVYDQLYVMLHMPRGPSDSCGPFFCSSRHHRPSNGWNSFRRCGAGRSPSSEVLWALCSDPCCVCGWKMGYLFIGHVVLHYISLRLWRKAARFETLSVLRLYFGTRIQLLNCGRVKGKIPTSPVRILNDGGLLAPSYCNISESPDGPIY